MNKKSKFILRECEKCKYQKLVVEDLKDSKCKCGGLMRIIGKER